MKLTKKEQLEKAFKTILERYLSSAYLIEALVKVLIHEVTVRTNLK